jgi:hypothetical protein
MEQSYTLDDESTRAALNKAPGVIAQNLELALDRAAQEGADMMIAEASKSDVTGNLKSSIRVRASTLSRFITPTVNYAEAVEEGTGPAAGKARYYPNPDNLLDFLRQSPAARGFKWARKSSSKRGEQDMELRFRSRALAMSIYMKGTKPAPFVAPTAEKLTSRFFEVMDVGVERGVMESMA